MKMNSLQDSKMIVKLYKASQAGVKIQMIIRGICCLVPGIKGISENIEVISIVDRFLEHARIFIFHNGGDEKIYLSSADWMTRNLSYRVETAFPIFDKKLKKEIKDCLAIQLNDSQACALCTPCLLTASPASKELLDFAEAPVRFDRSGMASYLVYSELNFQRLVRLAWILLTTCPRCLAQPRKQPPL